MRKKNLFFSMLTMASMLFATSCSHEEVLNEPTSSDFVDATFTISTPEGIETRPATRSIGDGTTVNYVACAVYDSNDNEMPALRQYVGISDKKATYSVRLVKGQKYRVAFFAYKGDTNGSSAYYNMRDMKDIQISNANSNIEERDAFTNYVDVAANETMQAIQKDVTLKRPFAQLNLGSVQGDIEAAEKAGVVVTQSKIKVSNVYTAFNAFSNEVVGNPSEVTFNLYDIPTEDLLVDADGDGNNETYEYLALNYLLVGSVNSPKALTDVTFVWQTNNGKTNYPATTFTNVPVQTNYRTNIIGWLLTNPAEFNITIDEQFYTPDNIIEIWDGVTQTQPASDANEWTITTAAEWAYLKAHGTGNKNIRLAANLDFGGNEIKGLSFTGTFDGQGYTMSNMTLLPGGSDYSNGLFQGDASGAVTVKNVNIENVVVECSNPDQGYAGVVFGDIQSDVTLDGVNVKNAKVCGVQSVGGLVGFVASGKTLNVTNCSVDGSAISNYAVENESGFVAGLVGRPVGTVNVTNSTVTNTTIDAYYAARRGEESIQPVVGVNTSLTAGADVVVTKKSLENAVFAGTAAELCNISTSASQPQIVFLTADIDFAGAAMTSPIQLFGDGVVFDGQGHKISNVVCKEQGGYAISLFRGDYSSGQKYIRNLVIDGITAKISASDSFAAALWSDLQSANIEIDNVHIYHADIMSTKTSGGFVGFLSEGTTSVVIKNSSINSSAVSGRNDRIGAIVGRAYGCDVSLENVTVDGVTVNGSAATTSTLVNGEHGYIGTVTVK